MTFSPQSVNLLLRDVRELLIDLDHPAARKALRRVTLFHMMYGTSPQKEQDVSNLQDKKVLVLRESSGVYIVCNEYYQNDHGRVHIIPKSQYGQFDRDKMTLEYHKVSMDISEIVYEGDKWPADLEDNPSPKQIIAYLTGE